MLGFPYVSIRDKLTRNKCLDIIQAMPNSVLYTLAGNAFNGNAVAMASHMFATVTEFQRSVRSQWRATYGTGADTDSF